ncbi:MAG TPA: bifunctional molybdenum cofactor biosynthesis protein MoaC/MoaB [Candidatus Kapabacteria bacterium]|nr:bifunctional molybdenum cofactor biosynthesis protein MoaC/MoaB [Candidatus Kapabacteria bacterium]
MRDVSSKSNTLRSAIAEAHVEMRAETMLLLREGQLPKGDPLPIAKVAAIQAAKNTSQFIPYCHSLPIDFVGVDFTLNSDSILIRTEVKAVWKTGVEMEALTAAAIAALTIYDMTKMVDDAVVIREIRLVSKKGGKSDFRRENVTDDGSSVNLLRAAVLVLSDSVASGSNIDTSGKAIEERIEREGIETAEYCVLPDDADLIAEKLRYFADTMQLDLVLTTGGTGISPTDNTPEAMERILDSEIPGIAEAIRSYGQVRTPFAMLSRAMAGIRGKTIIVNLPGSERGAIESLTAILPALHHACKMIQGGDHTEAVTRSRRIAPAWTKPQ